MKNKILLFINIVLVVVYINMRSTINSDTSFFNNENTIVIKDLKTGQISKMDMEDYLIGVVSGEMPASFNEEALKAQAIAARTYAYYKIASSKGDYDITTDASTQVHLTESQMHDKWKSDYDFYFNKIKKIVNDTKDMVITYNDNIISAYYYAMSNGYTEDSINAFNEDKDYLKTTISDEDESNHNFLNRIVYSKIDFCNALNISCNSIIITNVTRNASNRVSSIMINNRSFTGNEIRSKLSLRSTDFNIYVDDDITIVTKGYGHGVGMSQYGANTMAMKGYSYEDIIKHYYQNTEIKDINSII